MKTRSLGLWVLLMAAAHAAAMSAERPNIVLVLADDLGVNDLACYGRTEHRTPSLDQLAAQGVRFTCAYTAQPICSPSRAALMTGKCPARLHLTNYLPGRPDAPSQLLLQPRIEGQLPAEEVTLAELLKSAGYATGLFGKWHLGGTGFGPDSQGFDEVVTPPADTSPSTVEGGKGEYAITAAAINFIERNRSQPFFCYIPHNNPHIPLAARDNLVETHRAAFHPTYAGMIETLDDVVGRLLHAIDSLGLAEQTIVVFTSDNGGLHVLEFPGTPATHNSPFRAGKGFLYEGGLRVPCLIRWPGQTQPGAVTDAPVLLTDLMPTLLESAGVSVERTVGPLDGVPLLSVLRGEPAVERKLFWHFPHYTNQGSRPAGAVRDGNWKLIEQYESGAAELYDLAADPGEKQDVSDAHADVVQRLRADLHHWLDRVGAQRNTPNPSFDEARHRPLYVEQDVSRLVAEGSAATIEPTWRDWRRAMNAAVQGRRANITPASGDIRLAAKDARVHGMKLRYEPEPYKNVLGYWTNVSDWAEWDFQIDTAGKYEVEIQQGCGDGSGGARVALEISAGPDSTTSKLEFTVQETGHFQHMIQRIVGTADLPAGPARIAIRPQTKPGPAVMDLRRIVLRPQAAAK